MKKIIILLILLALIISLAKDLIIKESLKYYLNSRFKTEASLEGVNLGFRSFLVDECNLTKNDFRLKAKGVEFRYKIIFPFRIRPVFLKIDSLRSGNKKIDNLRISLELNDSRLSYNNLQFGIVNQSASLSGYFDFNSSCFFLSLADLSLEDLIFLATGKKEIVLKGEFRGKVKFCFKDNKISYLNLGIYNLKGGKINIKKEASLEFLKKRLDEKSYSYLLDNLKNYKYDKGDIEAKLDKKDIILKANFSSKELGERNVTIKLHDLFAK